MPGCTDCKKNKQANSAVKPISIFGSIISGRPSIRLTQVATQNVPLPYRPMDSAAPVSYLKDYILGSQVGGMEFELESQHRGPRGTIEYVYYLPRSETRILTYRPLGFNFPQ